MNYDRRLFDRLMDLRTVTLVQGCRIREWRLTHDQLKQLQACGAYLSATTAQSASGFAFDGIPIRIVGQGSLT